ncbi:sulfur globule protein CV3-like [Battus philenor]|uniref:sulfur globule protein CV3-like n=1 Tax=Battus philenor TaxID=42288 RepID=UPI0035CF63E1
MALKITLLVCCALVLAVSAAPADVEQLSEGGAAKEDLQTAASHWGGHWGGYGGYGGHWGGWGGYYPIYGGYLSYPLYGNGYGWPYGYYGHHGYWWK